MTATLQITKERLPGDILKLSLKGSLDNATASELETAFNNSFHQSIYKFIIDLAQLDDFNSAGIGVFINASPFARGNNGDIVLLRPQSEMQKISLSVLSRYVTIADNDAMALKAFK